MPLNPTPMSDAISPRFKEYVEEMILNGERIKQVFDLSSPSDLYIIERLAFYRYVIPLTQQRGTSVLTDDDYANCVLDMYEELRSAGRIQKSYKALE